MLAAALMLIIFGGGGVFDLSYIQDMDKGVKEHILDDERREEIRAELKSTKKMVKGFNKGRKSHFKTLKNMNSSRETTSEEFMAFFEVLNGERAEFREKLIDARIELAKKITADEWTAIMEKSGESIAKRREKARKKSDKDKAKGREVFGKTREAILEEISDPGREQVLLTNLDAMKSSFVILGDKINALNTKENAILARHDAKRAEFEQLIDEVDGLRDSSFKQIMEFHSIVKENTNQEEWGKVMKQFNKDLGLTSL